MKSQKVALATAVMASALSLAHPAAAAPPSDPPQAPATSAKPITVMTRNLYLGADLRRLTTATTRQEFLVAAKDFYLTVVATDFPSRAKALAAEIDAASPAIVALQEVSTWRKGAIGVVDGPRTPATEVVYDYLELLRSELRARGLHYEVAMSQPEMDTEVPTALNHDIRLSQRSVILVHSEAPADRATFSNPQGGNFVAQFQLPIPSLGIVHRSNLGWTSVDVEVNGRDFRVVNTHLDPGGVATTQAQELVQGPVNTDLPVVVLGDLNSTPGAGGQAVLAQAGFVDTFPDGTGTCCYAETLQNTDAAALNRRIDYVLTRPEMGVFDASVVGVDPATKTENGLWPSDHAGVVVRLAPFNAEVGREPSEP